MEAEAPYAFAIRVGMVEGGHEIKLGEAVARSGDQRRFRH
jgi:hypothetical protein